MIYFELVPRAKKSVFFSTLSPFISLVGTLVVGAIMFAILGKDPSVGLYHYFVEPLTEVWSYHELLVKATPLILIAVGLCISFASGNWNIGAEGQFIAGAICGSVLPVMYPDLQNGTILPLMLCFGFLGGALFAAIPALFKAYFNTSEIFVSLMLVYVAQFFLDWLVRDPWSNPDGFNFSATRSFHDFAILPEIATGFGRAHIGIFLALFFAAVTWFFMKKSLIGFEIRLNGQNERAARFSGFSYHKIVLVSFLTSGALAGLAGIIEVSGNIGQLNTVVSPGYGFTAIIVAFLARLNPLGAIVSGCLLALSYLGGEAVQFSMGISENSARIFQGVLLFFVLICETFVNCRLRLGIRKIAVSEQNLRVRDAD